MIVSHCSVPGEKSSRVIWIMQPHLAKMWELNEDIEGRRWCWSWLCWRRWWWWSLNWIRPLSLQGFPFCRLGQAPSVKWFFFTIKIPINHLYDMIIIMRIKKPSVQRGIHPYGVSCSCWEALEGGLRWAACPERYIYIKNNDNKFKQK